MLPMFLETLDFWKVLEHMYSAKRMNRIYYLMYFFKGQTHILRLAWEKEVLEFFHWQSDMFILLAVRIKYRQSLCGNIRICKSLSSV